MAGAGRVDLVPVSPLEEEGGGSAGPRVRVPAAVHEAQELQLRPQAGDCALRRHRPAPRPSRPRPVRIVLRAGSDDCGGSLAKDSDQEDVGGSVGDGGNRWISVPDSEARTFLAASRPTI